MPIEVAESRDPKGLYKKARHGDLLILRASILIIEIPESAELEVNTSDLNLEQSVIKILESWIKSNFISQSHL